MAQPLIRTPITPQLLQQLRDEEIERKLRQIVDDIAKFVCDHIDYDTVLKALRDFGCPLTLVLQLTSIFIYSDTAMSRINALTRPLIKNHLETLVNPEYYTWTVIQDTTGNFKLRLEEIAK